MPSETDEIKQRLDLVEVVQEYVPLKKAGSNWKSPCPFHQEKSPSFMVSQPKQIWHCFGCHKGGDLFSFVQEIEGVDFYEALKILADKAGVTIKKKSKQESGKKQRVLDVLEYATEVFHKLLLDHPKAGQAREYISSRALKENTVSEFQIGYAPESWDALLTVLQKKGFSQQEVIDAGLAVYNQEKNRVYDRFRDRIMIPLRDVYGSVVGFTARALGEDYQGGKYINTPQTIVYDKSQVLFGLSKAKKAIKESGYVVIVEGNMDVIASHQAGVLPVVAVSGTALTELQLKLLKRFSNKCIFSFDADDAGFMASRKGMELALSLGMEVDVLTLPAGKDPDDCIKQDVQLWMHAITDAKHVIDYIIARGIEKNDTSSPEGKKAVAVDVLLLLRFLPNSVEQDHYLNQLSNAIGTSIGSIREAFESVKKQTKRNNDQSGAAHKPPATSPHPQPEKETQFHKAEKELLSLIISNLEILSQSQLEENLFEDKSYQGLYKELKNAYDSVNNQLKEETVFSEEKQALFNQLELYVDQVFSDLSTKQRREAIDERVIFLQRRYLKQQLQRIQSSLHLAEQNHQQDQIDALTKEFQLFSQQLINLE